MTTPETNPVGLVPVAEYQRIHNDLVSVVQTARNVAARSVNALMTASYWEIGRRIVEFEQEGQQRANYGDILIKRLGEDLSREFGRGFGWRNLAQMRSFYKVWPSEEIYQILHEKVVVPEILQTVSAKFQIGNTVPVSGPLLSTLARAFPLPWSAYVSLLAVKNPQARQFYQTEALRCGWSVRQLDRQINSQFYERTLLSTNKQAILESSLQTLPDDEITPEQAIKDPFVLEFLNLKDQYSETDLEDALIQNLADFLLELGDDFAFLGRQRRLRLDDTWFRIDLLFFHRRLKCLIVIDLKVGRFSYADAGQMHLYLNYAREHWMKPGENPPIGLILCSSKGESEVRYALDNLPGKILAAEYRTMLPDEAVLLAQLERARQSIEKRADDGGTEG
jgi:predicted nuclease of restriction endonuclease-like (RecB) superfamily